MKTIALLVLMAMPAFAHRLDEYLQGALISVEKNRVQVEITLVPGVAVLPIVLADMDADRDGTISAGERRAYAERVLGDVSLTMDGRPLTPQFASMRFSPIEEMREGRGEIQIVFRADLPPSGGNRKLVFENRHQARIAAYQVNALVPRDPEVRIISQKRNYTQSVYELDFVQGSAGFSGAGLLLSGLALLGTTAAFARRNLY